MNFVISIHHSFTNYDFIEDVLNFHTNDNKKSTLCYINFHPFLKEYASRHYMELKKIQLEDVDKKYYAIILGEDYPLLSRCKELKLRLSLIEREI